MEPYPWNEEEIEIITEHEKYHREMLVYLESLKTEGPSLVKPKKPSRELNIYLTNQKRIVGKELHEYLKEKICSSNQQEPKTPENTDFQSVKEFLLECVYFEKNLNKYSLKFHVRFGQYLEKCYELWREKKATDSTLGTWKEWLKRNLGISDSHARKKRELAEIIADYHRFALVSISFNEMYNRRKDIKAMLNVHSDICNYWRTTN